MKKWTIVMMCLVALFTQTARADEGKLIPVTQLPVAAQQWLRLHFAESKVTLAKVENDFLSKSYEVLFADGNHVEFDSKGNWEEIDCKTSEVPEAVIPDPILEYVRDNYPDATVVKLKKDRREYEVDLSNRIELTFDLDFRLVDIDR